MILHAAISAHSVPVSAAVAAVSVNPAGCGAVVQHNRKQWLGSITRVVGTRTLNVFELFEISRGGVSTTAMAMQAEVDHSIAAMTRCNSSFSRWNSSSKVLASWHWATATLVAGVLTQSPSPRDFSNTRPSMLDCLITRKVRTLTSRTVVPSNTFCSQVSLALCHLLHMLVISIRYHSGSR